MLRSTELVNGDREMVITSSRLANGTHF